MLFKNLEKDFLRELDIMVGNDSLTYIEAIIELCERYEIEPEVAATFLTKPIKEKIEAEASKMNMLRQRTARLPL